MWNTNGMISRLDNTSITPQRTRGCEHCCDCECHRPGRTPWPTLPMSPMPMQPIIPPWMYQQTTMDTTCPDNVVDFTRYANPLSVEVELDDDDTTD
jgi:hypothetical protein